MRIYGSVGTGTGGGPGPHVQVDQATREAALEQARAAAARRAARQPLLADVHTHSGHCAMWPPHEGRWPMQGTPRSVTSTAPSCKETATAASGVVQALALSREARNVEADRILDQALAAVGARPDVDGIEQLIQRCQRLRPTAAETAAQRMAGSRPLAARCASCGAHVRHDPGRAGAALSEHYTSQHTGGR